jgi:hypothetical protein
MWESQGLKEGDEGWGVPANHAGENPLGIVWDQVRPPAAFTRVDELLNRVVFLLPPAGAVRHRPVEGRPAAEEFREPGEEAAAWIAN